MANVTNEITVADGFTIEKIYTNPACTKYKWLLRGVCAVIAGRIVNEKYELVFETKKKAIHHAERSAGFNREGLQYVAEMRLARRQYIADYLAERTRRRERTGVQLSLFA